MRLSGRVQSIHPSPTLAINALAKAMKAEGQDVLSMAAGEPDFPTPAPIRQACVEAIEAGHTGYAPSAGVPALRQAVRERVAAYLGLQVADDQVVVSCGAKHCLYNAMQALLEPGCTALIQAPYWVSYPDQVRLAGAEPILLPCLEDGFGLNRQAMEAAIDERCRLLVLNSPSNPSGHVLDADDIDFVADLLRAHPDLVVLSDDIYDRIVYSTERPPHLLSRHPDLASQCLVINGVSKTYAMTGWRLGYAVGPTPLIAAMRKIQDQSTSNATTFVQHAAVTALRSPPELVAEMLAAFTARRSRIVDGLNALPGVSCSMPGGAFYAFASFSELLERKLDGQVLGSDMRLAEILLERERLAVVPGEAFGAPGFVRLSFACSSDTIDQALLRLNHFIETLD